MKIKDIVTEQGSVNPFVTLVSMIDIHKKELSFIPEKENELFIKSAKSQLGNLLRLLQSSTNWNIPEHSLRTRFHNAIPLIIDQVSLSISSKTINKCREYLDTARKIAVDKSNLDFNE